MEDTRFDIVLAYIKDAQLNYTGRTGYLIRNGRITREAKYLFDATILPHYFRIRVGRQNIQPQASFALR